MSRMNNLYLGKAGHLLVMSELLVRGWNVATPEVDRGDDIFVVQDIKGELKRIQVKTATGKELKIGHSAKFNLRVDQLRTAFTPDLHYVFVMRRNTAYWNDFIIISRFELDNYHQLNSIGSTKGNMLQLQIRISKSRSYCSDVDFTPYINNWKNFPEIKH